MVGIKGYEVGGSKFSVSCPPLNRSKFSHTEPYSQQTPKGTQQSGHTQQTQGLPNVPVTLSSSSPPLLSSASVSSSSVVVSLLSKTFFFFPFAFGRLAAL
eukprot:808776_1